MEMPPETCRFVLLFQLTLLIGTARCQSPAFASVPDAFQASTWNYQSAELGVDGNASTCAMTGYHDVAWWAADLGSVRNVSAVTVKGVEDVDRLMIRVGETWSDDDPNQNPVCAAWPSGPVPLREGHTFACYRDRPRPARFVSISFGSVFRRKLTICEVQIEVVTEGPQ